MSLTKIAVFEKACNVQRGFIDNNLTGNDYTYDANGNMTADKNKGITNIIYNHLNLPILVEFNNSSTKKITYLYNANGVKMRKWVWNSNYIPIRTEYLDGFQYKDESLQLFPTAEGYVSKTGSSYKYVFNYTDHLGNIRLSYQDTDNNGTVSSNEILEESNYYPFGMKHSPSAVVNSQPNYKYKYNGKELQDELGLNFYDYGARNYDPALGRWMNVDPLAEQMRRWSPYNYAFNNPMRFTDPDGMGPDDWIEYTTKEGKQSVTYDAEIKTKEKAEEKRYTNVKQVLPTAEVTNNVNGDKIVLNENGTYSVNGGSAINPADQAYTTEGGATINVNQSASSQIAPILQTTGDVLTGLGAAASLTGIGAVAGVPMMAIGKGISNAGTGLELYDNANTGTLTAEKVITTVALEAVGTGGNRAFKALGEPAAGKVVDVTLIGVGKAVDVARESKVGPYR